MALLQGFPQGLQGLAGADQEVVGRRGHRHQTGQAGQLPSQPSPFHGNPGLGPAAPAAIARGIGQNPFPQARRQAIHRPGIPPARPALEPLRTRQGIAQTQTRHPIELGEAANHDQVGIATEPGNQRLGFPTRHQWQKGLIADHQPIALQQGLEGSATPEATGGIVGIGDPQNRPRGRRWQGLGEVGRPLQIQGLGKHGPTPAAQGPAVIGKTGLKDHALPGRCRVPRRPGQQL